MKLIIQKKEKDDQKYFRIVLQSSNPTAFHSHTLDTKREVDAFIAGFYLARRAASNLVQELPCSETWEK